MPKAETHQVCTKLQLYKVRCVQGTIIITKRLYKITDAIDYAVNNVTVVEIISDNDNAYFRRSIAPEINYTGLMMARRSWRITMLARAHTRYIVLMHYRD